jgi:hypothetical protein
MLARCSQVKVGGRPVADTPLLVPSFSSKAFPDVNDTLLYASEFMDGPVLVSAYDLKYGHIADYPQFASLVFVDSGGYEVARDQEYTELSPANYAPRDWTRDMLTEVVGGLPYRHPAPPVVVVSYDNPRVRKPIADQVEDALRLFSNLPDAGHEILLKPETHTQSKVQVENIIGNAHLLRPFDLIGVTEKELGSSVLARMVNLAKLRMGLDNNGVTAPLHVFGSLDTVETPLYFLAGAEVFDGLAWLRYAYKDDLAMYVRHYGALYHGIQETDSGLKLKAIAENIAVLRKLQLQLRGHARTGSYEHLGPHAHLFEQAFSDLCNRLGGDL